MKAKPRSSALYIYAIGRQQGLRKLFDAGALPGGVAAACLSLVTEKLAAVVSECRCPILVRDVSNLRDPTWAAERGYAPRAVSRVSFAKRIRGSVAVWSLYSSPEPVREMLSKRRDQLSSLDRISDREEWG